MARSGVALLLALGAFVLLSATASAQPRPGASGKFHKHVCGVPSAGSARCEADIVTDSAGKPLLTTAPAGYGPADLQSAYNVAGVTPPSPQTIAIVDAYDDPNAEADLQVYRSQYGLPACTTANGCFRKVDQNGGTSYPSSNGGWAQEISLDVDMASAMCPGCKILLVEASSNSFANLAAAVDRAALLGATQISNSYGGGEFSTETTSQSHYNHPGVDITVSSGDNGYGVEFPAASQYVTAVGGTTLNRSSNTRGWTETVWNGAGSGCSAYISKPSWQTDTGCSRRTVADQSAVADPNTGVAVYDSFAYGGASGWLVFGGTSVAAPVVAGVDAIAGGRSGGTLYGSFPYSNATFFNDVVSGSNGSCGGTYLCTGKIGYDGPTGVGTPNGGGTATSPPPPAQADFTLSASPSSQSVVRGQSATYTVTVNPVNSFTGNVNFSVSGLPAGATFTMVPGSPASQGSVTINTSQGGWGTWTPVITGTSGSLSHTTSVTLTVRKK